MAKRKPKTPAKSLALLKVSELIADRLLGGDYPDRRGDRVVVERDGKDMGGWGESAIITQVYEALEEHMVELAVAVLAKSCQGKM